MSSGEEDDRLVHLNQPSMYRQSDLDNTNKRIQKLNFKNSHEEDVCINKYTEEN